MMTQEPWCKLPSEISRLTDWQIEHLYLKPAIERNERIKKEREEPRNTTPQMDHSPSPVKDVQKGLTKLPDGSIDLDCPKLKRHVINQFMGSGMSQKQAEETYHRQRHDPIMPDPYIPPECQ